MKVLVLGAGKMGRGAVHDLTNNSPGVERVTVADSDLHSVKIVSRLYGNRFCVGRQVDVTDYAATVEAMRGHDAVISCVPYFYNLQLAQAAIEARVNFCDLGGNNAVVAGELALDSAAKAASVNIVPDCGLAPGLVSILAMHGAKNFESIDSIKIRVGGLPQNPRPPLDYQLAFSVEGLINEYVEPARVIRNGKISTVDSLTELETLHINGFPELEAFQTSGGVSTLPETLLNTVRELDYKTIRYRGHCDKIKTMLDLGCGSMQPISVTTARGERIEITPRKFFVEILTRNLPRSEPDVVIIRVEFCGARCGTKQMLRFDIIDRFDAETDLTAMQRTTAFPASIVAQMMARGEIATKGAIPQERVVPTKNFIAELARRNIFINEQNFAVNS